MGDVEVPPEVVLAARTDQQIAGIADERPQLAGEAGELTLRTGGQLAALMSAEFPGVPELGRILVSASKALHSIGRGLIADGVRVDAAGLLSVAGLAGEQLDREGREEVPGNGG